MNNRIGIIAIGLVLITSVGLAEGADATSITGLASRLCGQDPLVATNVNSRMLAALDLAQAGPAAVEPLTAGLSDRNRDTRVAAAVALGLIRDPRAAAPLVVALGDEDGGVAEHAARALELIGAPATDLARAGLKAVSPRARRLAARVLGTLRDTRGVDLLKTCLKDDDVRVRAAGADALGKIGQAQATETLVSALTDSDWRVRECAALALGRIGAPAVPPLVSALAVPEEPARQAAAEALAGIGKPAADPLIAALKSPDPVVRAAAAEALGRIHDSRGVTALIACLSDLAIRRQVITALGNAGDSQAVGPLSSFMQDQDAAIHRAAVEALGRIGQPAVAALLGALKDADPQVRKAAAYALGDSRDVRAVDPLIALLQDKDPAVKMAAVTALGNMDDPRAVGALVDMLGVVDRGGDIGNLLVTIAALEQGTGQTFGNGWRDAYHGWSGWWQSNKTQWAGSPFNQRQDAGSEAPAAPFTATKRAEDEKILADQKVTGYPRAEAQLRIAGSYLAEKDVRRAREEYTMVLKTSPHPYYAGEAQYGLGECSWQELDFLAAGRAYQAVLAIRECRAEQRAAADRKLDTIAMIYRLRPDHPRLFFNEDMWPAIKARLSGDTNYVSKFQQQLRWMIPEKIGVHDWGSALMQSALLYRVTGDQVLLTQIRQMLRASLDFYNQAYRAYGGENANALAIPNYPNTRIGWLTALDWVWNDLAPAERRELAAGMARHVHDHLVRFPGSTISVAFYNADNMYWYAGTTLLGPELEADDYLKALALFERGYADHLRMLDFRRTARGDDGDFSSVNIEYTLAGDPHAEWHFFYTWQSAISPEIPAPWRHSRLFPNYVFWNMLPGAHHYGLSFAWHTSNKLDPSTLAAHLSEHMNFYGQTDPELAALSRFLRDRLGTRGACGRLAVDPIIFGDPEKAPPAALPPNLPLARHFQGSGIIFMRSGYGSNDTYALFNTAGQRYFSSYHYDLTHFTIYKNGFLALDTGPRTRELYYSQTIAHNGVLIDMPGETGFKSEWGESLGTNFNSSGQNCHLEQPTVLAFETGPYYSYAASDATGSYNSNKCAQMVRQFVMVNPDYFVVFDRVVSKKADYAKTWLLHTANEPRIAGKEFQADQGQGRLFVRTLYPDDAMLEKIGGPGKEFWVAGKNDGLPDNWPYWGKVKAENPGIGEREIPETMGRWRVEVKPGRGRTEDCFLHLLQATDRTTQKMVASKISERGGRIAVAFDIGPRTCTVTLNKTGAIGGHIQIEDGGRTVLDQDLAQQVQPQAGLALVK